MVNSWRHFFRGVGSILDLSGRSFQNWYHTPKSTQEALRMDSEALRRDWEKVLGDWKNGST